MTREKVSSPLFERAAGGLVWSLVGTVGQTVVQFVVLVILARLLTPDDFGIVAGAMLVVGLSLIFTMMGVGPAIVQLRKLEKDHLRAAFYISAIFGLVLYALIYLSAPLVEDFFQIGGLTVVLQLLGLVFPIKALGKVAESLAQRDLKIKFITIATTASFLFGYGFFGVTFAVMGFGVYALVAAHLAQAVIMSGILLIGSLHSIVPRFSFSAVKDLLYFGGGHTAVKMGGYAAGQGDNIVVARIFDAASLGIYERAYQLMVLPINSIYRVLDRVLFPSMASIQVDKNRLAVAYRRSISIMLIVIGPIAGIFIIFAPEIVYVVLGDQWDEVVLPLQFLAISLLFRGSYKIGDSLARATGEVYKKALRQIPYIISLLIFSIVGSHWGLPGIALGVTVATGVNYLFAADLARKITNVTWYNFFYAHLQGIGLFTMSIIIGLFLKLTLSQLVNPVVLFVLSMSILAIIYILIWRFFPKFYGPDANWAYRRLINLYR